MSGDKLTVTGEFTRENMIGYGHAAYCAGWKAAVKACTGNPSNMADFHSRDWFHNNPPAHLDEPLWRVPHPDARTNTTTELVEALREAIEWDGHDDMGEPAVWLEQARKALTLHDRGER
jgi:hypothetical protein